MTTEKSVQLHVGYVGKTRAGKRVEIIRKTIDEKFCYVGSNEYTYREDGSFAIDRRHMSVDITGPWIEEPAQEEYNLTGHWYGWNGGEGPVHPETVVGVVRPDGLVVHSIDAANVDWGNSMLFRIITPYVKPEKPREWWMHLETMECRDNHFDWSVDDAHNLIHVREVTEDDS